MKIIRQARTDPPIAKIYICDYFGGTDDDNPGFRVSLIPRAKDESVDIRIGKFGFCFVVSKAKELSEALKLLVDQIEDENA